MRLLSRALAALTLATTLGGCGHRMFSPRTSNPVIEDRVRAGHSDQQKMSVVSTRADRRTILILGPNRICAKPPPDVGEAVASTVTNELAKSGLSLGMGQSSAAAILQLTQRSQGLEMFRTKSFVLCNMYINGVIDETQYAAEIRHAFDESMKIVELQIREKQLPGALGQVAAPAALGGNPDTPAVTFRRDTTTTTTTTAGATPPATTTPATPPTAPTTPPK